MSARAGTAQDMEHRQTYRRHQLRMLALAAVAFAASAPGQSFLISVFVDDFLTGTGLSRTTFSALYAAGTVVSAAAMLSIGRMVDRGGLRITWLFVAAALASACMLASVATGAALAFLALALLRTSGQGAFTLLGTLIVVRTFERRRGNAIAAGHLGLTLASVALPPLVALLIVSTDWRTAYFVLALVVALMVLPLGLLLRTGPARRPTDSRDETAIAHQYPTAVRVTRRGLPDVPTRIAVRLLLVLAAPPLIGTAVTFHAVSILAARDIGYLAAGGLIGLLGAASAVGVVAAGLVVDRLSVRGGLLLPSGAVLGGTLTLLVTAEWSAYPAFTLLGLGMGAVGVVNGTVWVRAFGSRQLSRLQAMAQSSMITAAALAPMIPALSLSVTGGYQPGLLLLSLFAGCALVLALSLRPAARGAAHA